MSVLLIALSLLACVEPEEETTLTVEWVDLSAVAGYQVSGSTGAIPGRAWVRAVNAMGTPVAATSATVSVDGVSQSVALDASGYGELVFESPGTYAVSVGSSAATVHALASPLALPLDAAQGSLGAGEKAVHLSGSVLVQQGNTLVYAEPGIAPFVVLDLGDVTLADVKATHLNGDGLLDAVAWGGDEGYLLLGREGGGVSLGGAVRYAGAFVGGMDGGDLDEDGLPELLVAFQDANRGHFSVVFWGEGLGQYRQGDPQFLTRTPISVSWGDNISSGNPQITHLVELEAGTVGWERMELTQDGFVDIGPIIDLAFPPGSTVDAHHDLNTDGGDQVVVFGPPIQTGTRQFWAYDLSDNNPQYLRLETNAGFFDFADADADGFSELWMLQEGKGLVILGQQEGSYQQKRVAEGVPHGVLATPNLNGDAFPDLFQADARRYTWWEGVRGSAADAPWWEPAKPGAVKAAVSLSGPLAGVGNTAVGGVLQTGKTYLARMGWDGGGQVLPLETVLLEGAHAVYDLDVCNGVIWALTDSGLVRLPLDLGTSDRATPNTAVKGSKIACEGGVAVVLDAGTAKHLTAAGAHSGQTETVAGAVDLALVGGDVETCNTASCSVTGWAGGVVRSDASGTTWQGGSATRSIHPEGGAVSLGDADQDGNTDLIVALDGGALVARVSPDGVGPAEFFHSGAQGLGGSLAVADTDGNGAMELWFGDGVGGLWSAK